jgi:hypothetical protein
MTSDNAGEWWLSQIPGYVRRCEIPPQRFPRSQKAIAMEAFRRGYSKPSNLVAGTDCGGRRLDLL